MLNMDFFSDSLFSIRNGRSVVGPGGLFIYRHPKGKLHVIFGTEWKTVVGRSDFALKLPIRFWAGHPFPRPYQVHDNGLRYGRSLG